MLILFENDEIRIVDFKRDVIPKNIAFKSIKNPKIFMEAKSEKSSVRWRSVDIDIEASDLYDVSNVLKCPKQKLYSLLKD